MGEKLVGCGQKIDEGKNPGVQMVESRREISWAGAKNSSRFFFPCVPFALDAHNLTQSPPSECLEQAKICFRFVHSR